MKPLAVLGVDRCRAAEAAGHVKTRMFYSGLGRTIRLNQRRAGAALVPDDFLFSGHDKLIVLSAKQPETERSSESKAKKAFCLETIKRQINTFQTRPPLLPFFPSSLYS